jgi:hypothetical protein
MNKFTRTVLAALACSAGAAFAQGIAFITNMKGDVAVDGNARPLVLSELARGQKLTLGADATASVMYGATGKEYVVKGPGQYEVRDAEIASMSGPAPTSRPTEWRASNKVLAQVAQTSSASVRMRSLAPAKKEAPPKLVFPTDGSVGTLQPVFRWTAPDAKAQGELTLLVAGQEKPVHRAKVTGASYRIPAKLKPDTDYAWVLTIAGEEYGTGRFRTLPAEAIHQIDKRRPGEKAEFSDRVLFALMLQDLGATQEAKETWARLSEERNDLPELSALAK